MFAALNKYYRPLSQDEFLEMDIPMLQNAVEVAQIPKELVEKIWVKERSPFEVY